ncbi:MAG TPA: Ig-like domain-containing protein [Saprospiraceae bacterium]|nr:Ig-like domain-containing protein [Saprospiraceae bacterium]
MRFPIELQVFTGIAVVLMIACASPKPLTGGPKDTLPPRILDYESTPNKQTNFHEKEILITFDEWIVLKNVEQQLVISPLMSKKPAIKQKGKGILITLPDSLKENTTYTLNFGNAIQDLNEGNPLENFSFIFSTGAFLDSIQLSGKVTDAATLKPGLDLWVMLYPTGNDSAVYREKPLYLAKTNKEGMWSISNVRTDSFRVVALKDDNLNLVYDPDNELFGWLDEIQSTHVSATLPEIKVSLRSKRPLVQEITQVAPGYFTAIIPGPLPKVIPEFLPPLVNPYYEWVGDSLFIWSSPDVTYSGKVILGKDTTRIRADAQFLKNKPLLISFLSGRVYPYDDARLQSNVPILHIDTSLIQLNRDTTPGIPFRIFTSGRIIHLQSGWVPATRYVVKFLPGAVTDVWERKSDSTQFSFVVNALDQYSTLDMKISGLDSTKHYAVFIMTGPSIVRKYFIHQQSSFEVISKGMDPGKYTIELVEDRNNNGTWDPGDYDLKRQPERKMIFIPDNLRAGWDVELKMEWR